MARQSKRISAQTTIAEREHQPRARCAQGSLEAPYLGRVWLAWTDHGLRCLDYGETPPLSREEADVQTIPTRFVTLLNDYFAGHDIDPVSLPVDLQGTEFQLRVWNALRRVPRGQVRSYAGIARDIGAPRAMRAVGMANSRNPLPIIVPCHRIVRRSGQLGGYTGGLDRKRFLLGLEQVKLDRDRVLPGQLDLPL